LSLLISLFFCPPAISVTHFASPEVPLNDPGLALTFVFARLSLHISCVQTFTHDDSGVWNTATLSENYW